MQAGAPARRTLATAICKSPSIFRPSTITQSHRCSQQRAITSYGYTQSKALIYSKYGEPKDVLELHGHSISPPAGSNVVVRMLTCPINPADVNQIQGVYASTPEMTTDLGTSEPSAVAGNEGVGEVINIGSGVKSLQKGDWVIMRSTGMGTWRTHMAIDESKLFKIDDKQGLTPLQVGTVSVNPCTAYRMILDSAKWTFRGDEWFIQNGANSGVGRAAIQLGREWGFKSINVIRGRENKDEEKQMKDELIALGATKVITEAELMDRSIKEQIGEWTNGGREQIKVGLNCVGGKPATALAKFLSPGATLVTYGAMSKQPLTLSASMLIFKDLPFNGFWVSKWSDKHPDLKKQTVDDVLRFDSRRQIQRHPSTTVLMGLEDRC